MSALVLYESLPNELWEYIFAFIPSDIKGNSVSSWLYIGYCLLKAHLGLSGCWIFNELRLAYLINKLYHKRRTRFYSQCYRHVRNVHEYEFGGGKQGGVLRERAWSPQFRIPTFQVPFKCKLCRKYVFNPYLTCVMKHIEGIRGNFTIFELVCTKCIPHNSGAPKEYPERYILGSMVTGLQLEHK